MDYTSEHASEQPNRPAVGEPSRRALRKEAFKASHVELDAVLGWAATTDEPAPPVRKIRSVVKAVTLAAFMGVLVSLVPIPVIGAAAITMREVQDAWDHMDTDLPTQPLPQRSVIKAADGTKIAEFYSENRVPVSLNDVPQTMRDALLAIEDSRYYDHAGVNIRGTARALASNLLNDSTQGGSTITQQYVKQVLADAATSQAELQAVTSRTSYMRKLREARYAIALEDRLTKDQILEGYLNIAYFGDGAYGVGTAAKHYFNKNVTDLNLGESALLAGIVRNPSGYDPTDNLTAAQQRRNVVLSRMQELDYITLKQQTRARTKQVRLNVTTPANGCHSSKYPFFCQYVKQQMETNPVFGDTAEARQQRLYRGGMTITTTLDPAKQDAAQAAVDAGLGRNNRVAASTVTVEPGTGRVVSMALNRTFGKAAPGRFDKTELILPTLPVFQPGSNFKPITLAAALERGFDPTTKMSAPPVYAPSGMNYPSTGFTNSGSATSGTFNAAQAIWRSSNTWFIRLEEQVGVLNVAAMAQRLGITSLPTSGPRAITPRDASLTLGAYEVSPMELAGAYATFAARGIHCTPVVIDTITGATGNTVTVPDADCHEAIPASVADTIATIMAGTINGPDPYRTGKDMTFGRVAAGKTGTTQNNAAVWFSGFTPQYATSVAAMDPRGGFRYPLQGVYANGQYIARGYGSLIAGPIWRNIMASIHAGLPKKAFPPPGAITGYSHTAPDVRGLTLEQAYQVLTAAGYKVALADKRAPKDTLLVTDRVHSTTPAAGALVGMGTTITITMTAGSDLNVTLDADTGDDEATGPRHEIGGGIVTGTNEDPTQSKR